MTSRRQFISLLGGAATAWPVVAKGQQVAMPVVGFLHGGSPGPFSAASAAFLRGLGETGFVVGQHVAIDYRWAEDRFDRLPTLASDLVQHKVSLIFAGGGDVAALSAKAATATIPIVFSIGADPVRHGLVASMNRPGGNITGTSFLAVELRQKLLEFIRELVPKASTIAVLGNPQRPGFEQLLNEVLEPARTMGLQVNVFTASNESEIGLAFSTFNQVQVDALLVLSDPVYFNRRHQLAQLEASHKIPSFHSSRAHVITGGLLSYGASMEDAYRQAGVYAGRILKGENPSDLPVMQPTKFELVINLKTAKALDLTIPPMLLALADEVIE